MGADQAGGTAALAINSGGATSYTGGGIINNGSGNALDVVRTGAGSTNITVPGAVLAASGEGIVVRDTAAGGDISVTTGAVTALSAGKDGIDVQTQSLTGNVTLVANGDIKAGNAGLVGAVFPGGASGAISVTANGAIDARFGVDAENFGTGATSVTTVGPVTATTGNGIFALATGAGVTVNAGDVGSTGNTAIIARQTKAGAPGVITVAAGNVAGTTGIEATNTGLGATNVTTTGTVTGTLAEGINATGNGAMTIKVGNIVTGATAGLSLTTTGGDINVSGAGGFVGGSGNAATIQNNGTGKVTVAIAGASSSASGEGVTVRDTAAGGDISVTTGAVTALAAGKDGIDVQTQSLTGNVTLVANGDVKAGNAGLVGAVFPGGASGAVSVTANGAIDARFGVDAENFGTGATSVTTVGPVTATTGNGIFALATGAGVTVNAGDVGSTGNTAIIARQTKAGAPGVITVAAGNVAGTTGIEATNTGLGATNVTTTGTVTGTLAEGINATGNGAMTIKVGNIVTGATAGLSLTTTGGDINVSGAGGFVGGSGNAATIQNNGTGKVTVAIAGASSSASGEGVTVRDTAAGGDISVTTGAVTALAAGKDGIDVQTQSLTGNVTLVANGDVKAGNAGLVGAVFPGGASGAISVTANGAIDARFGVDAENFGTGATSVTTVGPVTATTGNGIFALATGAGVTVNAGDVGSTGNTAIIARQTKAGAPGVITVAAGNVAGTTGIEATNTGLGATNVTTTGTVTGTLAEGINATGNGAMTIKVGNIVTGATAGLSLTTTGGDINVSGAGGFVGGSGNAATIQNNGTGKVTVAIAGASSSASGEGVTVRDTAAGGDISVTTGAVTALAAGKDGIDVQTQSLTGNVTLVANGDVKAGNAGLVGAVFPGGASGAVSVTANGAIDARFGVDAENFGTGATSVTTVGPVTATTGNGIFALATGAGVTVNAGDVGSTGNTAIIARQTKAGAPGVITVAAGNVAGTTGIEATNTGLGATNVTTTATVTGTLAEGINATGNGSGNVTVTTGGNVSGATNGIVAQSTDGLATITTNGNVSAASTGIVGNVRGAGSIVINANAGIATASGTGILATLQGGGAGTIRVAQGAGSVIGASNGFGIRTDSGTSTGATTITVAGEVNASGAGNAGVRATSTSGNINVQVAATGKIDPDIGVDLATVDGALRVDNAGLITGTVSGVRIASTGTGTGAINNSGTITGGTNAVQATVNNSGFTLTNTGTLNGAVNVTGSNVATSTMSNAAGSTMNFGSGSSNFSGSMSNAGVANIGAAGAVTILGGTTNSGRINLVGAGSFTTNGAMTSTGVINAQNNLTTNVITIAGNYVGGGQILIDYSTLTNSADRIIIGGSATGSTGVTINRVGAESFIAGGFIPVITVTAGAAPNAFSGNNVIRTGFVLESFGQSPTSNTEFGIIQTVNPASAALGALTYIAEAASALLDEPISPYITNRANPASNDKRFSLWMRGTSGHTTQRIDSTISGGGIASASTASVRTNHQSMQIGADLGILNVGGSAWNLNVGAMGGWYDGQAPIVDSGQLKVETPFAGGYIVAGNGVFMIEGTVRKEWRHFKIAMPTLFGSSSALQKTNGDATAASVRASYRIGGQTGFAATPFASFRYADTGIDPLQIDAISTYTPGNDKTSIGQAGLRLAYRAASESGTIIEPFVSAARLENWSRGNSSTFAFGAPVTSFSVDTVTWKNAMRYSAGIMANAAEGRVTGFLVGNLDDGSRLKSFAINAGVRFNF
ncbi:MAG: hypothetical protein P0Y64_00515 [Candidatus Sphingomonas colombiensis]|nr:hypothetical protein [Sphingomonas sp.]WEK43376.1 MAG: hypothetical protein P0Y64_00515 [Sphingomonas sp.]